MYNWWQTESICFLGEQVIELLLWNQTILIEVSSLNHFLEDVIILDFSQLFGNLSEVLEGNIASSASVEGDENFADLFSGLVFRWSGGHHVEELVELELTATVLIDFGNHVPHSFSLGFNTESIDWLLKFWI